MVGIRIITRIKLALVRGCRFIEQSHLDLVEDSHQGVKDITSMGDRVMLFVLSSRLKRMITQALKHLMLLVHITSMTVAETRTDYACKGEAVRLFYIEADSEDNIYRDHDIIWKRNIELETKVVPDRHDNLWLLNFTEMDEGLYRKISSEGKQDGELHLVLTVPPYPGCKPIISASQDKHSQEVHLLNASLPDSECGKPLVEVFWLNGQHNSSVLRVNVTELPGPHFVCIKGVAMKCVKNRTHTDHCSAYINERGSLDAHMNKYLRITTFTEDMADCWRHYHHIINNTTSLHTICSLVLTIVTLILFILIVIILCSRKTFRKLSKHLKRD
ncbi:hypothetical protein CHS0354_001321 [Potamilus streckersoni]|uniref:Uncharacterized protein n=1 Tax=Potamilus streckersoni TaxID=2493646 RepID=A0AAE0RV94_9BIVA|nr:hypothetical protein CHS0354_001321 [Potamilus streckersoni]